ncbi:MAG: peptidoglycan D,D-transpeptidase FtsI family protein [Senegalia sp. (in: firmicutes)]|uniref:peptidoglycan D,D-transpeptidase FtsI family protein n=1 Tax=Senegalia sp. (in: firmicutes) TaxID=1924098 RepID=UPI003F959582
MLKKNNRLLTSYKFFVFVFILLIIRIFSVQIISGDKFKEKAENQRNYEIVNSNSGNIYDRNMKLITNREKENYMYISINNLKENMDYKKYILEKTKLTKDQLDKTIKNNEGSITKLPAKKNIKSIENGIIIEEKKEYSDDKLLSHVIGYINENGDGLGIKKQFNSTLSKVNNDKISLTLDGKSRLLSNNKNSLIVSKNDDVIRNSIQLTIDYNIQKIVEDAMEERNYKGSVIVTERETGDILALTSQPDFDLNDISKSNNLKDNAQMNRAIQIEYYPASIFKTVVLLAALNEHIDLNEKYNCTGSITIKNRLYPCHDKVAHGELTLKEAYAVSCNTTFIDLANKLGGDKIIDMVKKLDLTEKVDIGLDREKKGYISDEKDVLGPTIGNLALGQEHIRLTPLQINNVTMIIANNGIKKDMSIIKGYATNKGDISKTFERKNDEWIIESEYTDIVKNYMESVVKEGTAKSYIDLEEFHGAAGKTGTAQAINDKINGLFTGFSPIDNPKYVVTVIVEDIGEKYSSSTAVEVFNEIIRKINLEK